MARPLRIGYAGAIHHVTAHGAERRPILRSDADRRRFLKKLRELRAVHHVEVYAYAHRFGDRAASLDTFVDVAMRRREAPVPVEEVTAAFMAVYGVSEEELLRRGNREAKDFWVRLLHEAGGLSQREIGRLVGHSDGTTISRCLSRLASAPAGDSEAARYQALRARTANSKA